MGTSAVVSRGFACPVARVDHHHQGATCGAQRLGLPRARERRPTCGWSGHRREWRGQQRRPRARATCTVVPLRGVYLFANSSTTAAVSDRRHRALLLRASTTTPSPGATRSAPARRGPRRRRGHRRRVRRDGPRHRQEGVREHHAPRGADLSARPPPPVKASTTTAVSATTAGEPILGIPAERPGLRRRPVRIDASRASPTFNRSVGSFRIRSEREHQCRSQGKANIESV